MIKKIFPSMLSCDFCELEKEAKKAQGAKADGLHLDIMDGHFVNNLSMGPQIVAAINRSTDLFLDVHLMTYNPYDFVEMFIRAGADQIGFHLEATEDIHEIITYIKKCNKRVSLAVNPETPVELVFKYLPLIDNVLLMTVHPGHGGQKFIPKVLNKIDHLVDFIKMNKAHIKKDFEIQVDGGINPQSAKQCIEAGVNSLVLGNYLFKEAASFEEGIKIIRDL
jgi:ribulose-phosphate 3-epimerase